MRETASRVGWEKWEKRERRPDLADGDDVEGGRPGGPLALAGSGSGSVDVDVDEDEDDLEPGQQRPQRGAGVLGCWEQASGDGVPH